MHPRPNTMERVDPDEEKLGEAFKHPFGIILLYIQASLGMVVAVALSYFLLDSVLEDKNQAFLIGTIFAVASISLTFLVVVIGTYIYRQNRLIITDRNVTQVLQYGLFNRKVSQLNINNVEDVTAIQNGFFSTIFNYGTLKIETAGEQMNFHYTYCPNANYYAKIVLDARERMLGQMKPATENFSTTSQAQDSGETIKELGAETLKHAKKN